MRSAVVVIGSLLACLMGEAVVAQDKPANTMDIFREKARVALKTVIQVGETVVVDGDALVLVPDRI